MNYDNTHGKKNAGKTLKNCVLEEKGKNGNVIQTVYELDSFWFMMAHNGGKKRMKENQLPQ